MLVLLSFGFVLVATVLLVLGLLSDGGLTLIYFSIGTSIVAAGLLLVAYRLAKPSTERPEAPEPLPEPESAQALVPTATVPVTAPIGTPESIEEDVDLGAVSVIAPPESVPWADEVEFPIADYDDLRVNEIMPLLPQLYSDELDVVEERERAGKSRRTILDRIAELRVTGTDVDSSVATGVSDDDEVEEDEYVFEDEDVAEDAEPDEDVTVVAPVSRGIDLDDPDARELTADDLPIEDYDELTVAQISSVLDQLEDDELEELRFYERSNKNRAGLLNAIAEMLGEAPAPVPAKAAPKRAAAKKTPAKRVATPASKPVKRVATPTKTATRSAAPAKKAVKKATTVKKAAAKKTAAKKAAPVKKTAVKKATTVKKAAPAKKTAATKKTAAKKATAKKTAKKSTRR